MGTAAQRYTQVGNAVPVRLGLIIGDVVADALVDLGRNRWQPDPGEIDPCCFVYIKSHVRIRRWFRKGKARVWGNSGANEKVRYARSVRR